MTTTLYLEFDSYDDFDAFLDEHADVVNLMSGPRETDMTRQLRQSVAVKKQLPEFFRFTSEQMGAMVKHDAQGMQELMKDDRVRVEKDGEDSSE